MNEQELWKAFEISGSVFDYLKFKNLKDNNTDTKDNENKNSGTNPQTTEYW